MLDYKKERFENIYAKQPFDVVVDSVGGESIANVINGTGGLSSNSNNL